MSTYTGRRRGFDLPRQEQSGLSVYSVPAVAQPASNTADQVSRVLAALGQTASSLASYNRQEQAALDRRMLGVADEAKSTMLPRLQAAVLNDPSVADMGDDEIESYARQIADKETAGLGLESSPRVLQGLRADIAGSLATSAFGLREEKRQQIINDDVNALAAGLPSAASDPTSIQAIVDDMRSTNPRITSREIQGHLQSAADSLAIAGNEADKGKLDNLLSQITDQATKASLSGKFINNVNAAKRSAENEHLRQIDEGFETAIRDRPHMARAYIEGVKNTIPSRVYNSYSARVDAATEADWAKTQKDAYDSVVNTIVEQGADAAESQFKAYLDNGVLEPKDKINLSRLASDAISSQYKSKAADISSGLARGEISPEDAFAQTDALALDIETRNEKAISDPYSFGAVDPATTRGLLNQIESIAAAAADRWNVDANVGFGVSEMEAGRLWVPDTLTLSSGEKSAKELSDMAISAFWEKVQTQITDPREQRRLTYQAMSLAPLATLPKFRSELSGVPSLGYTVATETDPDRRAAAFTRLNDIMGNYDEMVRVNPTVATRHIPEGLAPVFEFIGAARAVIPESDMDAWRAAMGAVRQDKKLSDILSTNEIDKLVDRSLKSAGLSKDASFEIRQDARNRIEVMMIGLGADSGTAVSRAGQSMKNRYSEFDGGILASGEAQTGRYVDLKTLRSIMLGTVDQRDREGLVLRQDMASGAYRLVDKSGVSATEPVPVDRALDLVKQSQDFANGITQQREAAIRSWLDAETGEAFAAPTAFGPGSPILGRMGAGVFRSIQSKAVRSALNKIASGYASGMAEAATDPFVKSARTIGGEMAGALSLPDKSTLLRTTNFIEAPGPGRRQ